MKSEYYSEYPCHQNATITARGGRQGGPECRKAGMVPLCLGGGSDRWSLRLFFFLFIGAFFFPSVVAFDAEHRVGDAGVARVSLEEVVQELLEGRTANDGAHASFNALKPLNPLAWGYLQLIAVQDGGELDFVKSGSHVDLGESNRTEHKAGGPVIVDARRSVEMGC